MGKPKRDLLWRFVMQQDARSESPEEMFVDLSNLVFDPNLSQMLTDMRREPSPEKDALIRLYVDRPFPDWLKHEDARTANANDLVDDMRRENGETPDRFTYELSLAYRICRPKFNIVLVGATGSGKTFKLSYIWHKYLLKVPHCPEKKLSTACQLHQRVRVRFDIDAAKCSNPDDFHDKLYNYTISELEKELGQVSEEHMDERFAEFLAELYRPGEVLPPYCGVLNADGLTPKRVRAATKQPSDMPRLESIYDSCRRGSKHFRELLQLVLRFCGWLRDRRCNGNSHCLYLELDNVDASPSEVQEAVVALLEDCDPRRSALIVCACRIETLRSWIFKRDVLDVVYHKGPSAHEVVLSCATRFIQSHHGCATDSVGYKELASRLHNDQNPRDFVDNVIDLTNVFGKLHIRALFENTFGQQIRGGVLFATALVQIAARLKRAEVKQLIDESSIYALERLLYRPFGMNSPQPKVTNAFALSPKYEHRLLGLRILAYLLESEASERKLNSLCGFLGPFASQEDVIATLGNLVKEELVLAKTRHRLEIDVSSRDAMEELLRTTDTGQGLFGLCSSYNYVCALMYYVVCSPDYQYQPYSLEERKGEPRLKTVFDTLTLFLKEMSDIEYADLVRARGNITDGRIFAETYGPNTLMHDFYERAATAICRIAMAADHELLLADASYLVQQYEAWLDRVAQDFHWPRQAEGVEYSTVVEELRKAQQKIATSGGSGGSGALHHGHRSRECTKHYR